MESSTPPHLSAADLDASKMRRHKPVEAPLPDAGAPVLPLMNVPPPLTPAMAAAKHSEVMRMSVLEPPPITPAHSTLQVRKYTLLDLEVFVSVNLLIDY